MATKRVAAKAKAKPVARRATAEQRQRALELAVQVSSIRWEYVSGGGGTWPSSGGHKERQPSHEEPAVILKTAAGFLAFLTA